MKIFFSILIFLSFQSGKVNLFSVDDIYDNMNLYIKEICSHNGIPKFNATSNKVICECGEKYTNEPRKDKIKRINGHIVQCSYEKKSRFYALFLSLCISFGFDFLYLERYIIFSIIFILSSSILILNIVAFIINYNINFKTKETKIKNRVIKIVNKKKIITVNDDNENIKILNLISKVLLINHLIYMTIDVVFHLIGKITDGNKVETENDLGYIFSLPD